MTTRCPNVVVVGGYRYAIEQGRGLIHTDGEHRRGSGRIILDLDDGVSTPDRKREVLMHELLHAIRANAGLSYPIGSDEEIEEAKKAEERFITSVEWGLVEVLRANTDLVTYLTSKEKDPNGEA